MSNDAISAGRRGIMFVVSSPSGAGKTTLTRRLLAAESGSARSSVSATTRPMRPGETDGVDYHFMTAAQFDQEVEAGAFLEWAHVFGQRYGTPRASVEATLRAGTDVVFDVDWQGGRALASAAPDDVVRVFILPPSVDELERRLRTRGDDAAIIAARMERARQEISHWTEYDYLLVNDDIDACFESLRAILLAERLKRVRYSGAASLARSMAEARHTPAKA